jgi:hypothetical protein
MDEPTKLPTEQMAIRVITTQAESTSTVTIEASAELLYGPPGVFFPIDLDTQATPTDREFST